MCLKTTNRKKSYRTRLALAFYFGHMTLSLSSAEEPAVVVCWVAVESSLKSGAGGMVSFKSTMGEVANQLDHIYI